MNIFSNINLHEIEEQPDFAPLPDGTYHFYIEECKEKTPKSGGMPYLALKLVVVEGEYSNRNFFCNLSILHPSDTPRNIALARLRELCEGVGITDLTGMAPEDLVDKQIMGRIKTNVKTKINVDGSSTEEKNQNLVKFGPVVKEIVTSISMEEIPF